MEIVLYWGDQSHANLPLMLVTKKNSLCLHAVPQTEKIRKNFCYPELEFITLLQIKRFVEKSC